MEFSGDKVARETQYFADPFEASTWRAQWVERMDAGESECPGINNRIASPSEPEARGNCSGGRVALAALLRHAGVGSLSFFEVGRPLAQV